MAEELQSLLRKINDEGVKKAEAERERILSEAKDNAKKIVADAKKEAEGIVAKGVEDARNEEKRAAESVRQASRDVLLALEKDLQKRLKRLCAATFGEAMTASEMGEIVLLMAKKFASESEDAAVRIQVLLSPKDLDKVGDKLFASLKKSLKDDPELLRGEGITGGLKLGVKGKDLFFDFSDSALSEMLCAYLDPRLASMLNSDKQGS